MARIQPTLEPVMHPVVVAPVKPSSKGFSKRKKLKSGLGSQVKKFRKHPFILKRICCQFRILLPLLIVFMMLTTSGIVWILQETKSAQIFDLLSEKMREHTSEVVTLESDRLLQLPEAFLSVMYSSVNLGILNYNDGDLLLRQLMTHMVTFHEKNNIGQVVIQDGFNVGIIRAGNKSSYSFFRQEPNNSTVVHYQNHDDKHSLKAREGWGPISYDYNHDPTQKVWYKRALEKKRMTIAPPHYNVVNGVKILAMSISRPLLNSTGDVVGVVMNEFRLCRFMLIRNSRFKVTENGDTILIDLNTNLFISGTESDPDSNQGLFIPISQSLKPRILAFSKYIEKKFGSVSGALEANELYHTFSSGGTQFAMLREYSYLPSKYEDDSNWCFILFVPHDDLFPGVVENRWITVGVTTGVLILSILITVVSICIFSYPLTRLSNYMRRVGNLQLDRIPKKGLLPLFSELAHMTLSFRRMIFYIEEFKQFLPDAVRAQYEDRSLSKPSLLRRIICKSKVNDPNAQGMNNDMMEDDFNTHDSSVASVSSRSSASTSRSGRSNSTRSSMYMQSSFKVVSVMHIRFSNFNRLMHRVEMKELLAVHSSILDFTQQRIKITGGILDRFDHNEIVVSFNAVRPNGRHQQNAVRTAYEICQHIENNLKQIWAAKPWPEIPEIVFCVGGDRHAQCGVIGTTTSKKIALMGPLVPKCRFIQSLHPEVFEYMKHYKRFLPILVDQDIAIKCRRDYQFKPYDCYYEPHLNMKFSVWVFHQPSQGDKNDEWMYELKNQQISNSHKALETAFLQYAKNDLTKSLNTLGQFLDSDPNNKLAIRLQDKLLDLTQKDSQSDTESLDGANQLSEKSHHGRKGPSCSGAIIVPPGLFM